MAPRTRTSPRKRRRPEDENQYELEQGPEEAVEVPPGKKPSLGLGGFLRGLFGPSADDPKKYEEEVRKGMPSANSGPPPPKMTDQEKNAFIANRIDEEHFAHQAKEADDRLRAPDRKLDWQPDIGPDNEAWKEYFDFINGELGNNSILTVLDTHFEEGQKYIILPPGPDGPLLEIQRDNTEQYKASLKAGGTFHGVHDNMTTKMTMLHFGLPVEPMSRNNIFRAGQHPDEDDEPDEDMGPDRYQRIYYASKPLEFLDTYWERGIGNPLLRRKCIVSVTIVFTD